jgi:hypothetical protein
MRYPYAHPNPAPNEKAGPNAPADIGIDKLSILNVNLRMT